MSAQLNFRYAKVDVAFVTHDKRLSDWLPRCRECRASRIYRQVSIEMLSLQANIIKFGKYDSY